MGQISEYFLYRECLKVTDKAVPKERKSNLLLVDNPIQNIAIIASVDDGDQTLSAKQYPITKSHELSGDKVEMSDLLQSDENMCDTCSPAMIGGS